MAGERVAVAVWGERVSPLFDVSRRALLLDLAEGRVVGRDEVELPEGSGEASLAVLRRHGVTTLLCGAVSEELALRAAAVGLELVPFLAGEVEAVISAYLASRLPNDAFAMPGCGGRWRRRGGRGGLRDSWGVDDERSSDMPKRDGTGPQGKGAGGGRGLGPCGGGGQRGGGKRAGGGGRGPGRGQGGGQGQGGGTQGGGTQGGGRGPNREA